MTKTATTPKAAKSDPVTTPANANGKRAATATAPSTLSTADKTPSKQAQLIALLVRDEGATLDQMIAVTGWLPHTTRAAMTGFRKKGYAISSDKVDGVRTYRAIAPELKPAAIASDATTR